MKGQKTGGRKKGTPNSATVKAQELLKAASEAGQTPLEYLLGIMRSPMPPEVAAVLADVENGEGKVDMKTLSALVGWHEMRFEAAKAAAPYVHPKLQAIEHKGEGGGPVRHKVLIEYVEATK